MTWLYFGDAPQVPYPHVYSRFYHWKAAIHFAVSDYELPEIIKHIATERDKPYVHREFMMKNPMQPKEYCYITPKYGMASTISESGKVVPNQTRWKLQWVTNNHLFDLFFLEIVFQEIKYLVAGHSG